MIIVFETGQYHLRCNCIPAKLPSRLSWSAAKLNL